MPTKKQQTTKVKKAEWHGYHRINLTREQTEVFERDYLNEPVSFDEIGILVNEGYKISFSWDDYNSGVSASMYAQNAKMEWAGYTLSAWAGDPDTAIKLLLFKHYVVAQKQWEIVKPEREGSSAKFG